MATDSLFILSPLPPVGSQSISRDLERERETEDKSFGGREKARGMRVQGQSRARRFICAACRFVATHRETNAYGKLQGSSM